MKTLKHKLLSIPDKEVDLSEEYLGVADNLIKDLQSLKNKDDVRAALSKYHYGWDKQMSSAAHDLINSENSSQNALIAKDKIYILIASKAIDVDSKVICYKLKDEYEKKRQKVIKKNENVYNNLRSILEELK